MEKVQNDHKKPQEKSKAVGMPRVLTVLGAIAVSWLMAALILAGAIKLFSRFF